MLIFAWPSDILLAQLLFSFTRDKHCRASCQNMVPDYYPAMWKTSYELMEPFLLDILVLFTVIHFFLMMILPPVKENDALQSPHKPAYCFLGPTLYANE